MGVAVAIGLIFIGIGVVIILLSSGIFYTGYKLWKKDIDKKFKKIFLKTISIILMSVGIILTSISLYYILKMMEEINSVFS